jgi:FkbM family methyltransferase
MYKPKEGDVVLDLGAGIGTELFLFSELVGKTGRVIAVEPDPQAFEYLRRLTQFLNFKNVTLVNVAVGVQNGTVQLAQNGHLGLESTLANMTHSSSVTVPVLTLPRLIQDQKLESVDFAKVNIEGAEKQLLGDKDTVSKVLNWCISCHDFTGHPEQRSKAHVIEALIAQGFRVETGFDFQSSAWALDYVYAQRTRL